MTDAVQIALIAGAAPTLLAGAAFVASLNNKSTLKEVKASIVEVHLSLNSRLSELVAASKAQGRQDERDAHSVTVPGVPSGPEGKG
jgi:hypothetical protein